MEKRFFPQYYKQELFIKIQTLHQGVYSVEDYVKEFEMLMIHCELQEAQEQTIARFISGLNKEIVDSVELQPCVSLENVIKLVVKIERQQRRGATRANKPYSSSSISISTYPSEATPNLKFKEETTKPPVVDVKGKAKIESSQPAKCHDASASSALGMAT